jgi:hypothetical protein
MINRMALGHQKLTSIVISVTINCNSGCHEIWGVWQLPQQILPSWEGIYTLMLVKNVHVIHFGCRWAKYWTHKCSCTGGVKAAGSVSLASPLRYSWLSLSSISHGRIVHRVLAFLPLFLPTAHKFSDPTHSTPPPPPRSKMMVDVFLQFLKIKRRVHFIYFM